MCGLCMAELKNPRKRSRAPDGDSTPIITWSRQGVALLIAADGSSQPAPAHLMESCAAVKAAVRATAAVDLGQPSSRTELQLDVCPTALDTSIAFCQRVHNVGAREASVEIAWRKSFLPTLASDPLQLYAIVCAARALDATPLRALSCKAAGDALRSWLLDNPPSPNAAATLPPASPLPAAHIVRALGGVDALVEVLQVAAAGDTDAEGSPTTEGSPTAAAAGDAASSRPHRGGGGRLLAAAAAVADASFRLAVADMRRRQQRAQKLGLGTDLELWCKNESWENTLEGSTQQAERAISPRRPS